MNFIKKVLGENRQNHMILMKQSLNLSNEPISCFACGNAVAACFGCYRHLQINIYKISRSISIIRCCSTETERYLQLSEAFHGLQIAYTENAFSAGALPRAPLGSF